MTNRHHIRLAALVPMVLAASLVACATGTAPTVAPQAPAAAAASPAAATPAGPAAPAASQAPATGKKPAAAPPPVVQAEIQKSLARVARPIADPEAGKTFKASQYWDYELGTPFEIEDTTITGLGDADKDGRVEVKIVSDVKLPNAKTQAKLMRLGKYALTQMDDGDEDDGDDEVLDEDDDEAGDDEPGDDEDDVAGGDDADDDDGDGEDDTTAGSADDDDADIDEDWDFDDWEDEIDLAEVDEEIDEESDDIVWEDDWLVDADGDGEWDEGAEADYAEDFTEEEEDTFLTAPHQCELVLHDAPGMSNADDLVTVTDKDTGETLTITFDQEWVHFAIKTSAGGGEIEYLPDGSYMVDGEPAADVKAVAARLGAKPWFQVTSRYTLGLLAGRLGRFKEEASRTPDCRNSNVYRLADGTPERASHRSFDLVNALVGEAP